MQDSRKIRLPRIALLGAGSMGGAILAGLSAPGVETGGVRVTTRSAESARELGRRGYEASATDTDPDANARAVEGAHVVVLAVKPLGIAALAAEISPALADGAVVVSVAAGVRTAAIERELPEGAAVVRVMPNTPATIGRGVTGMSAGSSVSAPQLAAVRALFETVGVVQEVPESDLDALTAISGSGPAYVFYVVEKLAAAARELGLDPTLSDALAVGTVRGAAELLAESGEAPTELRRRVTSPNGTTERAIAVLDDRRLGEALRDAAMAARTRAVELADEFDRR